MRFELSTCRTTRRTTSCLTTLQLGSLSCVRFVLTLQGFAFWSPVVTWLLGASHCLSMAKEPVGVQPLAIGGVLYQPVSQLHVYLQTRSPFPSHFSLMNSMWSWFWFNTFLEVHCTFSRLYVLPTPIFLSLLSSFDITVMKAFGQLIGPGALDGGDSTVRCFVAWQASQPYSLVTWWFLLHSLLLPLPS